MGWTWYSGKACLFSGTSGDMILQDITITAGAQYVIKFTISGMTQGKLVLDNFTETHEFAQNGTFAVLGTAQNSTLVFKGMEDDDEDLFNGCIDSVGVYQFQNIDTMACSPCINVAEEQDECLLLLTVEDSGANLGFDWSNLTLKARVSARFAKVEYDEDREAFSDNGGDFITTYFDGKKSRNLLVNAAPLYIHDFLFMCRGVSSLMINGVEYSLVDDRYPSIEWNKNFTLGTVELKVRKKNYKLNKTNCG